MGLQIPNLLMSLPDPNKLLSKLFGGATSDSQAVGTIFNANNTGQINPDSIMQKINEIDKADDGQVNGSIFKNSPKDKVNSDLINTIIILDKADDNKLNGSVFKNKAVREYLDVLDDGKVNGSTDDFINMLQHPSGDKDKPAVDNELTEGYDIFKSLKHDKQSDRTIDDIFRNKGGAQYKYNPNEYYGNDNVDKGNYNYSVKPDSISGSDTAANAAKIALGEIGHRESDGSFKKYTNGRNESWCADFVTWAFKKANGGKAPWGNATSVSQLKAWGENNGKYVRQKDGNGIKAGDIAIFKDNGASHTGIVTKIDKDGTIHTIEGNTSNKVAERTYKPGNSRLSGFVKMDS